MIAIDTNVLVRYLVQDDLRQADLATEILEGLEAKKETCWISDVVLCEAVWVLESCYDATRDRIYELLEKIVKIECLSFASKEVLRQTMQWYQQGPADFADYLIAAQAQEAGATKIYTFDKKLKQHPLFTLV